MDTAAQVITATDSTETPVNSDMVGCDSSVSGGFDVNKFANKNAITLFWSTVVLGGVMVLLVHLFLKVL